MVSPGAYPLLAAGDGPQGAPFKGIDGEYVSLATVAHRKSAGWGNLNELELLNSTSGGGSMEGTSLSSNACMTFPSGTQSIDGTEGHVGAFFLASDERVESIPTRHLMNFKGFMDISSQMGSMAIVNPSVVVMGHDDCPVSNNGELRQHYMDLSTSPQSFVSQPHTLGHMYNSVLGTHANLAQAMVLNKFGTNTWASGNELPFLPISDAARVMQPLAARPACMEPGQQQTSPGISLLMPRPHQLLHDEQGSMPQHGSVSALTIDDTGVSPRSNQGLSLSLSACQNPAQMQRYEVGGLSNYQGVMEGGAVEGRHRDEGYLQKWLGSSDQWRTQSHGSGYQEAGLQSCDNSKLQMEASIQAVSSFCGFLNGSKYLKAAQLILEEVASLGSVMKRCSSSQKVLRSLMVGGGSLLEHALKGESLAVEAINGGQKVVASAISLPNIAGGLEQKSVIIEPSLQENHDLQLKKAKLVAMLDEVDRRYKLYFSQMEVIVHTFESAAGLGAAKTYTALALQTISKHFRSLRDAIGGQIQAASRALGDDPSSMGLGRLRYVDQQWRAQAALQQLGMVQQHAWRPQRGLPERAVSVLRAWLFEHFLHPYPKDADKHLLAQQTGLTRNQVSNWFINARVRLWKPMVEEMYIEEMKEAQLDRKASAKTFGDHNHILEASDNHRSGISSMDDLSGAGILDSSNKQGQRDEVGSKDTDTTPTNKQSGSNMPQHAAALDSGDGLLLRGLGAVSSYGQGFRQEEGERKEEFEGQDKHSFAIGRMEEHHALGSYHGEAREFATMQAGYRDISLTLGLQHSDYLSLAQAQQQSYQYYLQQDQQQQHHILGDGGNSGHTLTGSRRRLDELEDYDQSIDSTKNYEAVAELQTRKRFAYNVFNYG